MLLAEGGLVDFQCTPHQRLGFLDAVGFQQQSRQVVQICRHIRVLLAQGGLVDFQRTPHQRLGLSESIGVL